MVPARTTASGPRRRRHLRLLFLGRPVQPPLCARARRRPTLTAGARGFPWHVQFTAPAEHYDRFMGRYVPRLAVALADAAGVRAGMRVLDVGCGPGGLTRELAARVGEDHVAAIDPAEQFAAACRARNPGADVRVGAAEELPFDDGEFDAALSSLVIAFMRDADAGAREMARVTRPGRRRGRVHVGHPGRRDDDAQHFWRAARRSTPRPRASRRGSASARARSPRCSRAPGSRTSRPARSTPARTTRTSTTSGSRSRSRSGRPARTCARSRPTAGRDPRRGLRAARRPAGPFDLDARAWYARGTVPG